MLYVQNCLYFRARRNCHLCIIENVTSPQLKQELLGKHLDRAKRRMENNSSKVALKRAVGRGFESETKHAVISPKWHVHNSTVLIQNLNVKLSVTWDQRLLAGYMDKKSYVLWYRVYSTYNHSISDRSKLKRPWKKRTYDHFSHLWWTIYMGPNTLFLWSLEPPITTDENQ